LGRCKQKQRELRGLLCRWPSITEWEMYHCSGLLSPKWPILCWMGCKTLLYHTSLPFLSVLWHCWLGDRKGIQPVKKLSVG